MLIEQSKEAQMVSLSQEVYIDTLLSRFNLTNASTVMTPLTLGTVLSKVNCPTTEEELRGM
jgi:hypothetical protein